MVCLKIGIGNINPLQRNGIFHKAKYNVHVLPDAIVNTLPFLMYNNYSNTLNITEAD